MPKLSLKRGTVSKSIGILIQDSTKTDGSGLISLANNTPNLVVYYYQPGITWPTIIPLVSLSSPVASYISGGFVEVSYAVLPGHYRFDIPNACLSGATDVIIEFSGAANMARCRLEIELTAWDNQDDFDGGMSGIVGALSIPDYFDDQIRLNTDTNIINFAWTNSTATFTVTKSINNASYVSVSGSVSYVRLDGTSYIYALSYNSADRPTSGSVTYKLTDGITTRFLRLDIIGNVVIGGYAAGQDPATLVLDVTASSHDTVSTIGHAINAAGVAADPWTTALPGAYSAGSAGYIIGNFASATDPWSVALPGAFSSGTAGYIIGHFASVSDPWSIALPGSFASGTAGYILSHIADSWAVTLPGSYSVGTAGYILGHNINATITSRQADGPVVISGYSSGQDPATLVLGAVGSSWDDFGTIGYHINIAGGGVGGDDPWSILLPGIYTSGTAGYILGHNLNAQITSRLASGPVTVGNYSSGQDPGAYVWNVELETWNGSGTFGALINSLAGGLVIDTSNVWQAIMDDDSFNSIPGSIGAFLLSVAVNNFPVRLSQDVPLSNDPNTIGDCLNAARAQGFGSWSIDRDNKILYLYAADGITIVATFDLDSITTPSLRTVH